VLQAHVAQIQTLQNELESLIVQLANLKSKSSQLTNHAQHVQGSRSWEGPPKLFYGLSHDAMVREYVFSNAHNFSLTPKFAMGLFRKYIWSLDILELNVLIAFSFLITIGEVCMFKSETSLLGVNNVID
jgi:hypothetical protein